MNRLFRASVPMLLWSVVAANSSTAHSASLTLFTDAPTESPLLITPLDADRPLVVSVVNTIANDPPEQWMTAWQFRIHAVPDVGTTGTLNFLGGMEPNNYVFAGVSHPFGPASAPLPGDPTIFTALDFAVPTNVACTSADGPGGQPVFDHLCSFGRCARHIRHLRAQQRQR